MTSVVKLCFNSFRASWTFLTRIPVGGFPYPQETWTWISMWFPVVGLCLGAVYATVWWGLAQGVSTLSAVLLTVSIGFLITGGFHEDGLADTCDAMGGGYTAEDVLRILKDSRIGTFGTLGVVSVLAIRCSLLLEIDHVKGWILGQSLSRVAPVALLGLLPYARRTDDSSKSRDVSCPGRNRWGSVPSAQNQRSERVVLRRYRVRKRRAGNMCTRFRSSISNISLIARSVANRRDSTRADTVSLMDADMDTVGGDAFGDPRKMTFAVKGKSSGGQQTRSAS